MSYVNVVVLFCFWKCSFHDIEPSRLIYTCSKVTMESIQQHQRMLSVRFYFRRGTATIHSLELHWSL